MNLVLLQAAGGFDPKSLILFAGVGLVAYFMIYRPQQKKQKEVKSLQEGLKTGDKVVTAGGFHGSVITVDGEIAVIELAKGTNVKIEKASITTVVPK